MKMLRVALLMIAMLLCSIVASAHDFEVDGIYYKITSSKYSMVSVSCQGGCSSSYSGEVVIPESVVYKDKRYSVTSIGESAFRDCTLNSLVIGTGVTTIGSDQTTPVKTIWLTNTPPREYKYLAGKINYVANEQYTDLSNTKVYPYLSSMFEVDGITYVPVNMTERTCDAIDILHDASVEKTAINSTVSFKGVTMTVKEAMPYIGYNNEYIKNLTISNLGNIGASAFYGCSNLQEVTLSEGVTSIGISAFSSCSSLSEIKIPNSVTSVEGCAFSGCSALTSVSLGNSVKTIGENAFEECSSLPEITIPQSVKSIGDVAFSNCTALADVIICDRTEALSLGSNGSSPLFADCPLDSVYIGGKITYDTSSEYGYSPFYRNTSLRSVMIGDKEEAVYDNEFYGCTNLKNVSIGNGVKSIGNWAFSGCSSLDQFSFGGNVESIGQEAFSDCTNMTQLISSAVTPPTCGSQALEDINKWNCTLKVPKGYAAAYQAADQWKDFFFVEDVVSSIDKVIIDKNTKADIYTIDGRLYMKDADVKNVNLPSGIYIIGGKKVLVK